jgi:glycogen operon protein
VTSNRHWGEPQPRDKAYHARVVRRSYEWADHAHRKVPMEDLIIYELHVRGFTFGRNSGVSAPGTFLGVREKIPYLKWLGVTAVELMPIFEFDEMMNAREFEGKMLLEYWGYNTVSYFAPNA